MNRARRTRAGLIAAAMLVAACGVDPIVAEGPEEPAAPPAAERVPQPALPETPEPAPAAPLEEAPPPRESPTPAPEPDPEPEPEPAPAPVPAPAPQDGPFELGLFFAAWGDLGVSAPSPNARTFTLLTTLPVGARIAYEVLPARRDEATHAWSVIADPQYARRGIGEVRARPGKFMAGMGHWNFIESVFDVTGYPCDLSEPFLDGCPMIARAWFALELEGASGTVRQPQHVRDLVGELGEGTSIIRSIPELFDLCSAEWFPGRCPTLIRGPQPRIELTNLMGD